MSAKRESEKYVAFWEIDPGKMNKIKRKAAKLRELVKSFPWEYPRSLLGPLSWEGENRGFQVFEVNDPQQLENLSDYWGSLVKITFQPIVDTRIWEIDDFVKGQKDEESLIVI